MKGPKPKAIPSQQAVKPPDPPAEFDAPAALPEGATTEDRSQWEATAARKADARKAWRTLTRQLASKKVLADSDYAACHIFATSMAGYLEAQRSIDSDGPVILSNTGTPVKNPYTTVQNQCWDRIRPLLTEFGLSPSARARLKLDDDADTGDDFF